MLFRLGLGLGLFVGSLALGWWLHRRGGLTEARAARLVRWIVKGPSPVVLCLAFWKINLRSAEPWLLPFLGALISFSTLVPATIYAKRAKLSGPQVGSFLTCAFFSNLGYLGAFTAFALFGEVGYGLCMLYLIFFSPCFYTWGFWVASRYGRAAAPSGFSTTFNDELRLYPFVGMLVGALLNLASVHRPMPLERLNHVLIPLDTALYLIAIGSQLTFASPRPWLRPCLAMSGIKFLYTPCIAWLLLTLFNIHGLPRFIVLLEASTPVAVSPLVLPLLFGLDRKLSNALWLFTTILAVPWLILVIPALRHLSHL
jgi:predicted permease